jgi:hypothetical protein
VRTTDPISHLNRCESRLRLFRYTDLLLLRHIRELSSR